MKQNSRLRPQGLSMRCTQTWSNLGRTIRLRFCVGTLHTRVPLAGTSGHPGYLHTNGSLCALQVLEDTEDPIWEIR